MKLLLIVLCNLKNKKAKELGLHWIKERHARPLQKEVETHHLQLTEIEHGVSDSGSTVIISVFPYM